MTDDELVAELKRLTEGLLFMSESDYPFEVKCWEGRNEIDSVYLPRNKRSTSSPFASSAWQSEKRARSKGISNRAVRQAFFKPFYESL